MTQPGCGPQAERWEDAPHLLLPVEDSLATVLRAAALLMLKHPAAAQAAFRALVAEGRRFAQTPEGRRWQAQLAGSELIRRGRALWEGSMLNALEDSPEAVMPSAIIDAVVQAISRPDLDRALLEFARGDANSNGSGTA
ncbi:MAG: hypothetical protein HY699_12115 [Deltaproteobacteria bacterium]|nr:hypothetical protein [Deltaproteobacteria bacterium]